MYIRYKIHFEYFFTKSHHVLRVLIYVSIEKLKHLISKICIYSMYKSSTNKVPLKTYVVCFINFGIHIECIKILGMNIVYLGTLI